MSCPNARIKDRCAKALNQRASLAVRLLRGLTESSKTGIGSMQIGRSNGRQAVVTVGLGGLVPWWAGSMSKLVTSHRPSINVDRSGEIINSSHWMLLAKREIPKLKKRVRLASG